MRKKNWAKYFKRWKSFATVFVDMYVKIETQRRDFYRSRQQQIRQEQLQGIIDNVIQGQQNGFQIELRVIFACIIYWRP